MSKANEHLALLGLKCKDRVTGFKGVITSISFDLYGCIQATVNPGLDAEEKQREPFWFDVNRLEITNKTPVMQQPDFVEGKIAEGRKGPAEKPKMFKV